jgi:hypothetical protein
MSGQIHKIRPIDIKVSIILKLKLPMPIKMVRQGQRRDLAHGWAAKESRN